MMCAFCMHELHITEVLMWSLALKNLSLNSCPEASRHAGRQAGRRAGKLPAGRRTVFSLAFSQSVENSAMYK